MSNIVVVAIFKLREGAEEAAIEALTPVIDGTHGEAGCLSYALHRGAHDPLTLVIVERWTSMVALESHMQQPYVAALGAKAGDLVSEPPIIQILEPIPLGDPIKGTL